MTVPVTSMYASLCALLIIALSYLVSRQRKRFKVGLGSAERPEIEQAMRVQANAVEYIPITLVLLLAYELNGGPAWAVHLFGAVLFVSRILHAWGFSHSAGVSFRRYAGTAGTWLTIVALAVVNLLRAALGA